VSSSAQVINLWVRSDLEDPMNTAGQEVEDPASHSRLRSSSSVSSTEGKLKPRRKPPALVEMPYITLLNRQLPPTIRILAWSPVSSTFSSRFSCIWRHYKYFFSASPTNPFLRPRFDYGSAYSTGDKDEPLEWQRNMASIDWKGMELDVELMRDAVARLVGDHDFRNLCKVDPPKQLTTHQRTVISATIDPVEGEGPDMFVVNLRGSAFVRLSSFFSCEIELTRDLPSSSTTKSDTSSPSSSSLARASSPPTSSTASSGPRTVPQRQSKCILFWTARGAK
jgi:tRNA pseudouridine38/39 synthase